MPVTHFLRVDVTEVRVDAKRRARAAGRRCPNACMHSRAFLWINMCLPEVALIEGGLKAYAMASYRDELYWRNADTAEDRKALVELLPAYLNCLLDKASWTSEKRKRAANAALVFADTSAEIHHPLFRGLGPW